jgi:hypothetical protein
MLFIAQVAAQCTIACKTFVSAVLTTSVTRHYEGKIHGRNPLARTHAYTHSHTHAHRAAHSTTINISVQTYKKNRHRRRVDGVF